jgi:hypothetical protein
VNAYVDERRMTEDVDVVSPRAAELATELKSLLNERFQIDVQVCSIRSRVGYRLYQIAKPRNRNLVDVRPSQPLPPVSRIEGVLVVTPAELIAGKVISCVRRRGKPKSFTDRRDLAHMLLRFPELKTEQGAVAQRLEAQGANEEVWDFWRQLVAEAILPEEEDDEFS